MGTKTYRVLEALRDVYPKTRNVYNTSELEAETVIIEPLRFTLPPGNYVAPGAEYESPEVVIEALRKQKSVKILYCSELTLLRMSPRLRKAVLGVCDVVTHNCKFQKQTFKYVGVHSQHLLCDPVPDVFIPKSDYASRSSRVIATGNISWQKNAPQVIEIFKKLKGEIERVYIGSANLWYDASSQEGPQKLQDSLYEQVDTIIPEATTAQIAEEFHKTRFGLWVAFHDTFATAAQEMIMAGIMVTSAKHPLASEIPVWNVSGVNAQVKAIRSLREQPIEALIEQSKRLTEWARKHVSYSAFQNQLKSVLKSVW